MHRPLPHIAAALAVALVGTAFVTTVAEARRGSGLLEGAAGAVRRLTRPPAEQQPAPPADQPAQRATPSTPGTAGKTGTAQEPATRDLRLVNETGKQIQYLFAVPVAATDWGRDWLGSDVLPDGEEVDAALSTDSCRYDLRAQFADGREILRFDVDVCAQNRLVLDDTSAAAPVRPGVAFLRVRNTLGATVMTFNVVRAGTRARPVDLFGAAVLPDGGVFTLRLAKTEPCLYAVEAGLRANQGPPVRLADQNLCGGGEFVLSRAPAEAAAGGSGKSGARTAAATTRAVEVVNASRRQLMFLYARPAGARDWNDNDLLGDDVVGPGQRFRIELSEGGCVFDFRARFNSGEVDTRLAQDVCREGRVTVGR